MGHSGGLKNMFSRFRRKNDASTPNAKGGLSPEGPNPPPPPPPSAGKYQAASPAKRLFAAFTPSKSMPKSAPSRTLNYSKHRQQQQQLRQEESNDNDLIPSSPVPSMSTEKIRDTVKVVVRVRPQPALDQGVALNVVGNAAVQLSTSSVDGPHLFNFDHVANQTATQSDIFSVAGVPIVENCLQGYNGCILAYGQTGSGKTYSMLGNGITNSVTSSVTNDTMIERGLIQRIFERIFEHAEQHKNHTTVSVKCSFLEIYNEQVGDLLAPSHQGLLTIRWDDQRVSTFVDGLSVHETHCIADVVELLNKGTANRKVGETAMNERSSRSHSVFIATIEQRKTTTTLTTTTRSRLYLVDLAGSERQKATGTTGDRLREAASINKSLSALGHVIMSLVDQRQGRRHVPYRDSKLTFLLQDALGGNSKMVMLACVSPALQNAAETLSTLRFVNAAKRIKIHATANEFYDADNDAQMLKAEIKRLKDQLQLQQQSDHTSGLHYASQRVLMDALRREKETRTEIERVRSQVTALEELVAAKELDTQRLSMMVKLKEARLASLASSRTRDASSVPHSVAMTSTIETMNQEIEMLKSALSAKTNSEVKRFAVENLQLRHQLASTQQRAKETYNDVDNIIDNDEENEVAALQDALLRTGEALEQADAQITHLRETLETERSRFKERDTLCCDDNAGVVSSALRLEAAEAAACREREEAERWCAHAAQLESKCESLEKNLRIAQEDEEWLVQSVLGELVECWNRETSQRWEMEEREERYRMDRSRVVDGFEQQIKELRQTHRKEIVAAELESLEAKEVVKMVKIDLEACKSRLLRAQEERTELEEALARADDTRVDLEYRLSDVSAELTELKQRNSGLLTSVKELGIFRRRVMELEDQLAEARLAAQAVVGPLERQREISVVRDELRIAQATLEVVREEAAALAGVVKKKDEELARLRADMAAEVNDAALQVQELLLAQERAEAAEARVRELEEQAARSAAGVV